MAAVAFMDRSWFPASGRRHRPPPLSRQLLLMCHSTLTPRLQAVRLWINACWASMDRWLDSLCCVFVFYLSPHHIDSTARAQASREIRGLLCCDIYQQAAAPGKGTDSGMNGTQRELRRDTDYRFGHDGAHFSVAVQQVAPQTNINPRCDSRGVHSPPSFHGLDVLCLYQAWANYGPGALTWRKYMTMK